MLVKGVVRLNLVSFGGSRFGDEEMARRNGWLYWRDKNGADLFCFVFLEKQTHKHKSLALINGGKILILLLFLKMDSLPT